MLEDAIDGATGVWGIGLLAVAGGALLVSRGGRPTARAAIRGWFAARDGARDLTGRVRVAAAEAGERVQDLYAEARAELNAPDSTSPPRAATP